MGRKKKNDIKDITEVDFSSDNLPDKVKFTPEQLANIMFSYTVGLNGQIKKVANESNFGNEFNPMLSQDYMQSIETEIMGASPSTLTEWVKNPKAYASQLRKYSRYLSSLVMQYKRLVSHFTKILTIDYELIPPSDTYLIKQSNKQAIDELIGTEQKVFKILEKLRIKDQYYKVLHKVCNEGIAYYFVSKTKDFITLIDLPTDYCYPISKYDLGIKFALDLTYFDKFQNMKETMPQLYQKYELFIKMRELGAKNDILRQIQYVVLPEDMGFAFTFDPIYIDCSPPLSGSFKDAIEVGQYKNLLRTKMMLDTTSLLVQQIPRINKDTGELIMDAKQAQNLVRMSAGMLPPGVKTISTPFEPQLFNFTQPQQSNTLVGLGESMLNMSTGVSGTIMGEKSNSALALGYSLENDFSFVDHMYRQFENFTNLMIFNRKHTFKTKFFGNRYTKNDDIKTYQSSMSTVNAPPQRLYALYGYEPFEIKNIVAFDNLTEYKDQFKPMLNQNQMSSKDIENNGRPKKDDSQLGDSGAITREYESNTK